MKEGDHIIIDCDFPEASLRPGMIACFQAVRGEMVIHRLLAAEEGCFITKGDNSPRLDPTWEASQYRGVLVAVGPKRWRRESSFGRWIAEQTVLFRPARLAYLLRWLATPLSFGLYRGKIPAVPKVKRLQIMTDPERLPRWERQEIGRELVLYDGTTDSIHVLNEVAAKVLRWREEGLGESDIAEAIYREYDNVTLDRARSDVRNILSNLCELKIIA